MNDYLFVSYSIKDGDQQEVDNGGLTIKQDGAFTVPLTGLSDGGYLVEVTVNHAGGNIASASSGLFQLGGDEKIQAINIFPGFSYTLPIFMKFTKHSTASHVNVTIHPEL